MPEKVPRLVANVDIRKFKLDPTDGFLLTRIDGRLDAKDLARETGLPEFSVESALEKLEKLGVIERIDPSAAEPPPPPPPRPHEARSALPQFRAGLVEAKYDPKELDEEVDLKAEQKKKILDVYYRLEDLDHYSLLGVSREADKKTVKRAYFELAALFHPDRYFKKNLGTFKAKMEVLFARVTEAHDTLVDAAKRLDYDAYIADLATTRGLEAMLERALAEKEAAAAKGSERGELAIADTSLSVQKRSTALAAPRSEPSAEEIRARKEALARRLMGGARLPSAEPRAPEPSPLSYARSEDAVDALKRRYEASIDHATISHAKKYVAIADDALAKKDLVAAANALGIAVKFVPDDAALLERYAKIKLESDNMLLETYTRQATYEEKQGHWADAARSWLKVTRIRPSEAKGHAHAASALLRMADGDLHEAAEHAKAAIKLEPNVVDHHITLVEIFMKGGLAVSARRAAEVAAQLDPKHVALQALLKQLAKR
jgi:curved DNA-binding protein CbpA